MSYSGIEHKLRVFISSKCGGKYTIARKALRKLLEATGLVEAYVFEAEPASSEDTQSAYLDYVDGSNLCVFLVDNKDGVPPAVLSEEKRAKDKQLRLLYLFCDENQKEPTPMQEAIKASSSQKYLTVHEFADIVSAAYDSVMQDVIAVYKRKEHTVDEDIGVGKKEEDSDDKRFSSETNMLSGSSFSEFAFVSDVLTEKILYTDPARKEPERTALEMLLADQLRTVLFRKPFDEEIIDKICDEVLKENEGALSEILKLRYQAQKKYYCAKYDDSLTLLQKAIAIAIEEQSVPLWISNDIAIDIRHVQGWIDERNNQITLKNQGQQYIDASKEPVYFPYLDREVENMRDEIAKSYYSRLTISPYTTQYGGLKPMFSALANAFCIAEVHGSIVQTEITRDRLIDIYSMLFTLYNDHDLIVEYISLLVVNRDSKKLDTLIRTYNQSVNIINGQDVDAVLECLAFMSDPVHQVKSKYLISSRLGNYMTDATFAKMYEELVVFARNWVRDDKRIINIGSYIFDFFRENTRRVQNNDIFELISEVFDRNLSRYYTDCFKVLRSIDYSVLTEEEQIKAKQLFVHMTERVNENLFDQFFSSAVIRYCKTTSQSYGDLEKAIAQKFPKFYENTFLLEMSVQRGGDLSAHINSYLEEEQSRNKSQGENGVYHGYAYESLDVVYNIIKTEGVALSEELLSSIVNVSLDTLAAQAQTIRAKLSAVKLLQFVYFQYSEKAANWKDVKRKMLENSAVFSVGSEMGAFSEDKNVILSFQYDLFLCCLQEPRQELLIEKLYSVDSGDAYSIIQFLTIINSFLVDSKGKYYNEYLISAFLFYSVFMSQHKERDVKYHATRCLIELTCYESAKKLALIHISQIMDTGSQAAKLAILTGIKRIQSDDDMYLEQIMNKGKADSNYLVRYVAERESHK